MNRIKECLDYQIEKMNAYEDHNPRAVKEMVERGMESKQPLYDILSKHPQWSEQDYAVVMPVGLKKSFSHHNAKKVTQNLLGILFVQDVIPLEENGEPMADDLLQRKRKTLLRLREVISQESGTIPQLDKNTIEQLEGIGFSYHRGQKSTRAVRRFMEDNYTITPLLETKFAEYADLWAKPTVDAELVISINPVDYLTMSNGNSWTTCLDLGSAFFGGVFSYMVDPCTIVVYVLTGDSHKPLCLQEKHTRVLLHTNLVDTGVLGCFYPSNYFGENIAQLIGKELFPSLEYCDRQELNMRITDLGEDPIYTLDSIFHTQFPRFRLGYYDVHHNHNVLDYWWLSDKAIKESKDLFPMFGMLNCEECGNYVHTMDYRYDEEGHKVLCHECQTLCEKCGEKVAVDINGWETTLNGRRAFVCNECGGECEECGTVTFNLTYARSGEYRGMCLCPCCFATDEELPYE